MTEAGSPASPASPAASASPAALLEALDRDGHVRQAWRIERWPLTIGRALDNDVVLTDPHVAGHHATIDRVEAEGAAPSLLVTAGETRNGLVIGRERIAGGGRHRVADLARDVVLHIGRTPLRLRLPGHALADEQPLAPHFARETGGVVTLVLALAAIALYLASTWISSDPEGMGEALGKSVLNLLAVGAVWCSSWALLSKIVARSSSFAWHVRVFVVASLVSIVVGSLPPLLAFAFDWPWLTDFSFIALYAAIAATVYFHLLAVEPGRQRLMKAVAVTGLVAGVALRLWFNVQHSGRPGEELYMSHLQPPQVLVAKPRTVDGFIDGLAPMQAILDKQAREPSDGVGDASGDDDDN